MRKKALLIPLFFVTFLVLFIVPKVQAPIYVINTENDCFTFSYYPDTNYNTGADNQYLSIGYANGFRYGWVNWNLTELLDMWENPDIPTNYIYVNVSVRLLTGGGSLWGMNMGLARITESWDESTITHNNRPAVSSTVTTTYLDYATYYHASDYSQAYFDVSDNLNYYLAINGTGFYGYRFYGSNGTQVAHIATHESGYQEAQIIFSSVDLIGEAEEEDVGEVIGITHNQFNDMMFYFLFLLVPSLFLAMMLRQIAGIAFCSGLGLMSAIGYSVGIIPIWFLLVIFVVLVVILFALFKKGLIGIG